MQRWLSCSPFFILTTCSEDGLDCSPKGDKAGQSFHILDASTIAIPDRRGNNRIDTLRNIVHDPRIGLLFMVPGVAVSLRVKGLASISVDSALRHRFTLDGEMPRSVILVNVKSAYVQKDRAITRAALWDASHFMNVDELPTSDELSKTNNT